LEIKWSKEKLRKLTTKAKKEKRKKKKRMRVISSR
jgi:hypothetical protein